MTTKKRILIVDDEQIILDLFQNIAARLGIEAVAVSDPREAQVLLKEKPHFNLILLDLIMPSRSGWGLLDEINGNAELSNVPVIITTGVTLSQKEMDKLLKRACAVVHKGSFDLTKFKNLLEELL